MNGCAGLPNEQGSLVAKQQQEQAQQLLKEAVSMTQIRAPREQSDHLPEQEQPTWLQVGLDGGWLPSREQKGGLEGTIGVVASQVDAVGKQGRPRPDLAALCSHLWFSRQGRDAHLCSRL